MTLEQNLQEIKQYSDFSTVRHLVVGWDRTDGMSGGKARRQIHPDTLAWILKCANLEILDLFGQQLADLPDELRQLKQLKEIILEDDYISDANAAELAGRFHPVRLKWTQGFYLNGKHGR